MRTVLVILLAVASGPCFAACSDYLGDRNAMMERSFRIINEANDRFAACLKETENLQVGPVSALAAALAKCQRDLTKASVEASRDPNRAAEECGSAQ